MDALIDVLFGGAYDLNVPGLQTVKAIVDVGAHIGLSALRFALTYPEATLVCIEPDPENFSLLGQNIEGRHFCVAAWSSDGWLELSRAGRSTEYSVVKDIAPAEDKAHINARTLDTVLAEAGITDVDILKMDVEGAEREIIRSGGQWIKCTKVIVLELHGPWYDFDTLREDMEPRGFDVVKNHHGHAVCINRSLVPSRVEV